MFPLQKSSSLNSDQAQVVSVSPQSFLLKKSEETQRKQFSRDTLGKVVQQFLHLEKDPNFRQQFFNTFKDSLSCDNYFVYKDRQISKLLLFDLVKEMTAAQSLSYSYKLLRNNTIAVGHARVQKKVLSTLDKIVPNNERNRRKNSITEHEDQLDDDCLVESAVIEDLQKEESFWNNFESEEKIRKISLSEEIFDCLMSETIDVFNQALINKLNGCESNSLNFY